MKKYILVLTLGFLLISGATSVHAQQEGQLELGGIINSPTGLSIKGWVSNQVAIDGALAFNVSESFSNVYLHSDILFHSHSLNANLGLTDSNASAYYGAGVRISAGEYDEGVGIRFPGGVSYRLEDTPLVTFFELAPNLEMTPDVWFGLSGAAGVRFNLN